MTSERIILMKKKFWQKNQRHILSSKFLYCQAQPPLNSTQLQLQLRLRLALFPISPATHPPTHPATRDCSFRTPLNSIQPQLRLRLRLGCQAQAQLNSTNFNFHFQTPTRNSTTTNSMSAISQLLLT